MYATHLSSSIEHHIYVLSFGSGKHVHTLSCKATVKPVVVMSKEYLVCIQRDISKIELQRSE